MNERHGSSLAAQVLKESFRKTGRIEIPSLNIAIITTAEGKAKTVPIVDYGQGATRPSSLQKSERAPDSMRR